MRPGSPPKVTVIITTYNHERFITEAVESVLAQKTKFRYHLVIIDDCSTDRTRDIVSAFQNAYPQEIRLVLSRTNKGNNADFMKAIQTSSSPYIAMLDGDDYWTSPYKLQKQADYLDQHPDCTLCIHNVRNLGDDGSQELGTGHPANQKELSTLEDLLEGCFISTCTTMFRRAPLDEFPAWFIDDKSADWSLYVLLAQQGTIGYINEVMAVYRLHSEGFWTGRGRVEQLERVVQFYENLLGHLPARYAKRIGTLLAGQCYELATEQERTGNQEAAQLYLSKCLRVAGDIRRIKWWLRVAGGSAAELGLSGDDPEAVRIAIQKVATKTASDIQLNLPRLRVEANGSYRVRFQARADRPRSITVGFAQAHEPWKGLGLYRKIELTSDWGNFQEDFVASANETNGRIHFDVGERETSVDLSSVALYSLGNGQRIEPDLFGVKAGVG